MGVPLIVYTSRVSTDKVGHDSHDDEGRNPDTEVVGRESKAVQHVDEYSSASIDRESCCCFVALWRKMGRRL